MYFANGFALSLFHLGMGKFATAIANLILLMTKLTKLVSLANVRLTATGPGIDKVRERKYSASPT